MSEIRKFVELVDSGAQYKAFSRALNLTLNEVKEHTTMVGFYRKYISVNDEIIRIRSSDMAQEEKVKQIAILRSELKNE